MASGVETSGGRERSPLVELVETLRRHASASTLGVGAGARGWVGAHLHRSLGRKMLAVAADEAEADRFAADLSFFLGPDAVVRIPESDALPYEGRLDRQAELDRLAGLDGLREGAVAAVVSAGALLRRVAPPGTLEEQRLEIAAGEIIDRDEIARRLVDLGYQNVPLVEDPGSFAVRGAIVDAWSPQSEKPLRIELFGDEIESLRLFDPESQRTVESLERARFVPAREILFSEASKERGIAALREAAGKLNRPSASLRPWIDAIREGVHVLGLEAMLPAFYEEGLAPLTAHLPKDTLLLLDDPLAIERAFEAVREKWDASYGAALERGDLALGPEAHILSDEDVEEALAPFSKVELHRLWLGGAKESEAQEPIRFDLSPTAALRKPGAEGLAPLIERLESWRELGIAGLISYGSPAQADKLERLLRGLELRVRTHPGPPPQNPAALWERGIHAHLVAGELSAGFVAEASRFALVSDEEVLGPRQRRRTTAARRADLPNVTAFRDLKEGDLCVHVEHGLCRYGGMQKLEVRGVEGDFLVLHFAGRDKLFLPVWRLRQIQKFVGGKDNVRLDRLGGTSWEKTKKRVKDELLEMAAELLRIYAQRKAHPGFRFPEPDETFAAFEASFPYEETPDQAQAIAEVLADMQSDKPMDRLVCGDVGFGKTEVALRAAFLAALSGKQTAVLVPTTILALQHFNSFRERMADFPVEIDWVSSLRSAKENREALRRVAAGEVDIIVGTHALLGSTVSFSNLGLLVIDEEQKFGVAHKEKLKRMRSEVDVLAMTATPIPRTLHMSMAGMRDMSVIRTPPVDRRAIRTFVSRFSPEEIRDAIRREKARGGQTFFVHNRVQTIDRMYRFLKELVPEVRIGVAHGQMPEKELEKVVAEFIDQTYDVLLCTTIIESGIDMPRANTILINRADTFGLSQLHQLRGRVGRSSERAYAYLFVPPEETLGKEAQQRLEAIQNLSELGSGFELATRDLEIRGAGNLLGAKQSGQIEAVGFDLYVELLEEAVAELRGEPLRRTVEPEVQLPIPAFLPDAWIPDVHQRLLFYKKLSQAESEEEIEEVREELVDRYGPLPPEADAFCRVMGVKVELRRLSLRALEAGPARLVVVLGPDAELDGGKLMRLVTESGGRYRLTPELKLIARTLPELGGERLFSAVHEVLSDLERCRAETVPS